MQKLSTSVLILISAFLFLGVVSCHEKVVKGEELYLIPNEAAHTETLIYIHGLGQNAQIMYNQFFADEATMIARKSTKVVLLTAPLAPTTVLKGKVKNSWFDISTFNVSSEAQMGDAFNFTEIVISSLKIKKVIAEEIAALKGNSKKVFIGGFSQGCFMSLFCALTYPLPLGGLIGSGGYLVPIITPHPANSQLPLFLTHGTADNIIYFDLADKIYNQRLEKDREIVKVYEEGVGHIITPTMQARARQFLLEHTKPSSGFLSVYA